MPSFLDEIVIGIIGASKEPHASRHISSVQTYLTVIKPHGNSLKRAMSRNRPVICYASTPVRLPRNTETNIQTEACRDSIYGQ